MNNLPLFIVFSVGSFVVWLLRFGRGRSLKEEMKIFDYGTRFWVNFSVGIFFIMIFVQITSYFLG